MKKWRIIGDVFLNIVATALPIGALQLIVFPYIASSISEDMYGFVIAIYSLFGIIPTAIGLTLNNIRLLHDDEYKKMNYSGDFNILTIIGVIINIAAMLFGIIYLEGSLNLLNIGIVLILSLSLLLHDYLLAEFRLVLNYKMILIDRIIQALGYLLGLAIFVFTNKWYFPFLFGYILSLLFVLKNTSMWKEKLIKTPVFSYIKKESFLFLTSTFLLRLTTYADKLLLYPILGGHAVSVYYAATVLSKITSLLITPINNVVLSYLTKITNKPTELFWKVVLLGTIVSFIGYFLSIFVSETLLQILYPTFFSEAIKYIYITSATTVINVLASIIQPFVLKFNSMKFQVIINSIDVIVYTFLSLVLLYKFGLIGFCIGVMISRILRVFLLLIVFISNDKELTPLNNDFKATDF